MSVAWLCICLVIFGATFGSRSSERPKIGIITRYGNDLPHKIIEDVLQKEVPIVNVQIINESVGSNDEIAEYFNAVCNLVKQGVIGIVTEMESPYFPILNAFSNRLNVTLIATGLPEAARDNSAPDLRGRNSIAVRPSTTRATLDIIRMLWWQEIVYIYDDYYDPEKLQHMYRIGYTVLAMRLLAIHKVNTAEDAIVLLRRLDTPLRKSIKVILDVNSSLANEIILRHVHDSTLRKKNFHYILTEPAMESFWTDHKTEFGALKITGFLIPTNKYFDNKESLHTNLFYNYFHDLGLVIADVLKDYHWFVNPTASDDCLNILHYTDQKLIGLLKRVTRKDGLTGQIQFEMDFAVPGYRKKIQLLVVETTPQGYREFATLDPTGRLKKSELNTHEPNRNRTRSGDPDVLPQIAEKKTLVVTTIIAAPYMMLKKNQTDQEGNEIFEGFCKDLMEELSRLINVEFRLKLVADGMYGKYLPFEGKWTGMIGEIISGVADIALGDITITAKRQRVVNFTDPFENIGFGMLIKHPDSTNKESSTFFIFKAFTAEVWFCILFVLVVFCGMFYTTTKYTGAPDSIESASGIWGRKNTVIMTLWFVFGTTLGQGTGVYPRSISSRMLSGSWWLGSLLLACMFIASLTAQLQLNSNQEENTPRLLKLKSLSMESILMESITNGWPKVGIVAPSHTSIFIKRSNVQMFAKLSQYLDNNPDAIVSSVEEGVQRVRKSRGDYILMTSSSLSDYYSRREPCDLVALHDTYSFNGFGLATASGSEYSSRLQVALDDLQVRGVVGHLHRKWWIESSECKTGYKNTVSQATIYSYSGIFVFLCIGLAVVILVFIAQYFYKLRNKEERLHQITFEDMNLEHRLPTPPPEMLTNPPAPVPVDHTTRL